MTFVNCQETNSKIDDLEQQIQVLRTQQQQDCGVSSVTIEGPVSNQGNITSEMTLQELMNEAMDSYNKFDIKTCSEDDNYTTLRSKISKIGIQARTTEDVEKYVQPIFEKIFEGESTVDFLDKCIMLKNIVSLLLMISYKRQTDITIKKDSNGKIIYIIPKGQFQKLIDMMNPIFYKGKNIDYSINSLYNVLLRVRKAKEPGMFGRGGRTRRYRKGKRTTTRRSRLAKVSKRYKRYKNKSNNQKRR